VNRTAVEECGWVRQPLLEDRVGTRLVSGGDVEIALRIRGAGYPLWYVPTCRLQHLIPARRTGHRYLVSLNRGLGVSQTLVACLTWPGSDAAFLAATVKACLRGSRSLAGRVVGVLRGATDRTEMAMDAAFAQGQWLGVWGLTRSRRRRRALLGRVMSHQPSVSEE